MDTITTNGIADETPAKPAHDFGFDPHGQHGPTVYCICGWSKSHPRAKVRTAAAERHAAKVAAR